MCIRDRYLSSSCSNALRRAFRADVSLKPQVQTAARAVLAALFERPGATPPNGKTAASQAELQEMAR